MVELNSNPEILLRKRKNADRVRIEKQEAARKRAEDRSRSKKLQKQTTRFVRAETVVARRLATDREHTRIKRVTKVEKAKLEGESTDKNFIEKVQADGLKEKRLYDGKDTLYFVIRVSGPHGVKIPSKVIKVLNLLRLTHVNTAVFLKLTETVYPLLKLISPYVIIGQPSLASVRNLIQKRATVTVQVEEGTKSVKLNDNNLVEEQLGEEGIICVEDIIHEIMSLGENFKRCSYFLDPFQLKQDIVGFGPLAKLKKLEKREEKKENKTYSNAGAAPVLEVDIDEFIAQQN
ncbi:hypothetical protein WICPIJ_004109 [Wickerhamomyces pijperi]|uniref:Ribosome biogenesis protein RLP7 n=1 Tax=Wickerhamomyces pijperi TaxID=599730 RepID=A0A9P8Q8B7_WICPI|nr:hypothetical protein WICPIJ_004109 [Wickerhamomyces pijperi]